jgi:DNA topoisomerase-1
MEKREGKLFPTELGFLVTDLLSRHFQDIMSVEYTAAMEQELDAIEEGRDNLLNTLTQFWRKFEKDLAAAAVEMKDVKRMEEQTDEVCDKCGSGMVIKWGRYGRFLACSNYPECKNTRQLAGGEGEGGPEVDEEALRQVCPEHQTTLVLRKGRYGAFLACASYPECKNTRRLVRGEGGKLMLEQLKPIDEKCPECGQDLAWRRGRFGPFIACSDYPRCKYIKKKEAIEIGMLCPE